MVCSTSVERGANRLYEFRQSTRPVSKVNLSDDCVYSEYFTLHTQVPKDKAQRINDCI